MNEITNTNTTDKTTELAAAVGVDLEARPIEVITAEIWLYKQHAGTAILEIGRRLIEAKAQLSHGEWLPWLEEKVEFSDATAQRFMRLAREYENPSLVTDLGASKALALLALPPSEREEFAGQKHEVDGAEKTVAEMSRRELEKVIKEQGVALKQARDAETATDELKRAAERAADDLKAAEDTVRQLRQELQDLQNAPKNVAVETVADKEAISAAEEAARKETEEKLKTKIEKAEKAREKAEQAKGKAEQDLAALKVAQEQAAAIAEREKQAMADQVQELQKKLAVASSSEMTIFKLHFEQGQESINKMAECIGRIADAGDTEGAAKLKNALAALLTSTLEMLE